MPRRPLAEDITAAQERRARLAAELAAEDAKLAALVEAQRALIDEVTKGLHDSHSTHILGSMQAEESHIKGVRIAAGRSGQSPSRAAQLAANLTDKMVAELTGFNRTTVCKWHNGTIRIPEDAQKLLAKRGVPRSVWSKR